MHIILIFQNNQNDNLIELHEHFNIYIYDQICHKKKNTSASTDVNQKGNVRGQ